jgi:hypothetical protein
MKMNTNLASATPLQQILGTDKRNPVFSAFRDTRHEVIHVYYGVQLLEIVPDDKEQAPYKLLVGRLYNAGVNRETLRRAFHADPKTMRRWGRAAKSGDSEEMARILAGRRFGRKLTGEIQTYIQMRFPAIYLENRYDYSREIREEIAKVFKKSLSGETVRPLLKELKKETVRDMARAEVALENGETSCDYAKGEVAMAESKVNGKKQENVAKPTVLEETNRKECPECEAEGDGAYHLCHHLGVLIFSGQLLRLGQCCPEKGWLLKQWLSVILLGAKNIEQTKLLDFCDLQMLLGSTSRLLHEQRQALSRISTREMIEKLFRFNAEEIGAGECRDFYYDPHTKHYTGMQRVLKGWCASIRFADKVMHMDFIHTSEGYPVYYEPTDNYEDLRERFGQVAKQFCELIGIEEAVTFIVDRGIYGHRFFEEIIDNPLRHIITWEKGYKSEGWRPERVSGQFEMTRCRNNAEDKQRYLFEYIDETWSKNAKMRLLRVLATNPKGNQIEVGVLTDDQERAGHEIVALIFRRWLQENDFKYLDEHFGINEITSYSSVPYENIVEQVNDKQMKRGAYKALEMNRKDVKKRLKEALLKEHQKKKNNTTRETKITEWTTELSEIEEQLKTTEKEMSRLDFLIEQNMVRLDMHNKQLMDVLKIIARNGFYKMLQPFKRMYNNYRDDHVLFRNLTRSNGLIRVQGNTIEAILLPTPHYPKKIRSIVERLLEDINAKEPSMPDGSCRQIQLRLGKKNGFKLAIVTDENDPIY